MRTLGYRVDKNEDGRITEEEVKEVLIFLTLLLPREQGKRILSFLISTPK